LSKYLQFLCEVLLNSWVTAILF